MSRLARIENSQRLNHEPHIISITVVCHHLDESTTIRLLRQLIKRLARNYGCRCITVAIETETKPNK